MARLPCWKSRRDEFILPAEAEAALASEVCTTASFPPSPAAAPHPRRRLQSAKPRRFTHRLRNVSPTSRCGAALPRKKMPSQLPEVRMIVHSAGIILQSKAEKALPELKAGVERRKAAERKVESQYTHATKTLLDMMSGLVRAGHRTSEHGGGLAQPAGLPAVTSGGPGNAIPDTAALVCRRRTSWSGQRHDDDEKKHTRLQEVRRRRRRSRSSVTAARDMMTYGV